MKTLILAFVLLIAVNVNAATLQFEVEQVMWLCPKGAIYVPMECKEASKDVSSETVEMPLDADQFGFVHWDATTSSGVHTRVLASRYDNNELGPTLSILLSVGTNENSDLNSDVFTEMDADHPVKTLYLVGQHQAAGTMEFVPAVSLSKLKFQQ